MRRVVLLYLPNSSTDRLRNKSGVSRTEGISAPDQPLCTALPDYGRTVFAAVDSGARARHHRRHDGETSRPN